MDQEFYFIRHGQTDYNLLKGEDRGDHPEDIPLNAKGRSQASSIAPHVKTLPFQTVCTSPLKRVLQTHSLCVESENYHTINNLTECNCAIWDEMRNHTPGYSPPRSELLQGFFDRVCQGIDEALLHPGPQLVIAHGGIHYAFCCVNQISDHNWTLDNCGIVHFRRATSGSWQAKLLT